MADRDGGATPHQRGQAELVSFVILVTITVIGITLVLSIGSTALNDTRQISEISSAEHAMTQFDSRMSLVALGSSTHQETTIPLTGRNARVSIQPDAARMNVSIVNGTDTDVVFDTTLGSVVYENGRTSVAYQGGGVWRKTDAGSTMISPPEFHYRTTGGSLPTLTLPLVVVDRTGPVVDTVAVEANSTVAKYPVEGDPNRVNPLTDGEVRVTVTSEYYRAWGAFFAERTGGDITYEHAAERVTINFQIPSNNPPLTRAVTSAAGGYDLDLGNKAEIDAYDSSQGPYSPNSNGTISIAGDVTLSNGADVNGSVESQGTVDLSNPKTDIFGDVICSNGNDCVGEEKGTIHGNVYTNGTTFSVDPVDGAINAKINSIRDDNDNAGESDIDANRFNCTDPCDITNGSYYLDEIDLSGEEIEFDTSGGDITIAVDGDIDADGKTGATEFSVTGPNEVRIYASGKSIAFEDHFDVETDGNQTARKFWLYARPGTDIVLKNEVSFVGVIYAPNNAAEVGEIRILTHSELYGGAVGYVSEVDTESEIHFDEALAGKDPLPSGGEAPITYLHISVNYVNASAP